MTPKENMMLTWMMNRCSKSLQVLEKRARQLGEENVCP
jgi:hypothetical protein